jgi:hypothetical protein
MLDDQVENTIRSGDRLSEVTIAHLLLLAYRGSILTSAVLERMDWW